MNCKIEFTGSDHSAVELNEGDCLSEKLTIHNSPILFGCRIGICGTCAVEIISSEKTLPPRTQNEIDFLETMVPGREDIRLACQIHINTNMKVKKTSI